MNRRARLVAATLFLLAGACGVPTDSSPRQLPADRIPFDLLNPDLAPPTSAPARAASPAPD